MKIRAFLALLAMLLAQPTWAKDCSYTTTTASVVFMKTSSINGLFLMNVSANLICIAFDGNPAVMGGQGCAIGSYPLYPHASAQGDSWTAPTNYAPTAVAAISTAGGDALSCTRY